MTLRPTPKTSFPPTPPLDPITASRLAHAASREVSGNLFRLLAEMSTEKQPATSLLEGGDEGDLGPPRDDDRTGALVAVAASVPEAGKPDPA